MNPLFGEPVPANPLFGGGDPQGGGYLSNVMQNPLFLASLQMFANNEGMRRGQNVNTFSGIPQMIMAGTQANEQRQSKATDRNALKLALKKHGFSDEDATALSQSTTAASLAIKQREGAGSTAEDARRWQAEFDQKERLSGGRGTNITRDVTDRATVAQQYGLKPGSPGYDSFVLTGKMPREDAQPYSASDKKAIREADEGVMMGRTAVKNLDEALKMNDRVMSGATAPVRTWAANNLPDWMVPDAIASPQQAEDASNFDNLVMGQALSNMKSIFGSNPTEGERKILLELQGSMSKPINVRKQILERAKEAAGNRLRLDEEQATGLRGQDYYKPGGGRSAPAQPDQRQRALEILRQRGVIP